MTQDEATNKLSMLLAATDSTIAARFQIYLHEQKLCLTPAVKKPTGCVVISTLSDHDVKYGLSVTRWITLTRKISLDSERIVECRPQSKPSATPKKKNSFFKS